MKPRATHIMEEFEALKSASRHLPLEIPKEFVNARSRKQHRNLFGKAGLDPSNTDHVISLCSIVYHYLYEDAEGPVKRKFTDDANFDLLVQMRNVASRYERPQKASTVIRLMRALDRSKENYRNDDSDERLRVRLQRARKSAAQGKMKLSAKRKALLPSLIKTLDKLIAKGR